MSDHSQARRRWLWDHGWRRCIWCGGRLTWKSLTCEHLKPKSKGGKDRRDNIAAACYDCNQRRNVSDWVPNPDVLAWAIRRGLMEG